MDKNTNTPVLFKGTEINTNLTIDGGAIHGCNITDGGIVTITNPVSVVQDSKVKKGGKLLINEGMAIDIIVEDGGYLELGTSCVAYNIWAKDGSEVLLHGAEKMNRILRDQKAEVTVADNDSPCDELTKEIMDSDHGRDNGEEFDQDVDHNPQIDDKDDDLQAKLEEDAKNKQFTEGATGIWVGQDEYPTVDHKNRTRLYIEGYCNYDDVLSEIAFFEFVYDDHIITIEPDLSDECIDTGDNVKDTVKIYIKHLPRYLDLDDFDLSLSNIIFKDTAPADLRFSVSLVLYEDAIVDVALTELHDAHVCKCDDDEEDDDPLSSIIILKGKLVGQVVKHWDEGRIIVEHDGVQYFVAQKCGPKSELYPNTMTFKIEITPDRLVDADGTILTGDEMVEALHNCKMVDWHDCADEALPIIEECIIDGIDTKVDIDWMDIEIQINGYSYDDPIIWDSIKINTSYKNQTGITIVDDKSERRAYFDAKQNSFTVYSTPRFGIKPDGMKIYGMELKYALSTCILTGFNLKDSVKDEKIEISSFIVNHVYHNIKLEEENEHYKLFTYVRLDGPTEEPNKKSKREVPEKQETRSPKMILEGKYKYFIPMLKIYLCVADNILGETKYLLWSNHSDINYSETDDVELEFTEVEFVSNDKKINNPIDIVGKDFKIIVESFEGTLGEFKPTRFKWGKVEYTFN